MKALTRFVPILDWGLHYNPKDLPGDITAGIIVTSLLVPQSMAYALLANLPPQVGLYASILPLILYAVLGTSRSLAVGPAAVDSLLVATGVGAVAAVGSPEYLSLAILLAFSVGVVQILLGVFRLGFLVNFISQAVIVGFTSGAAFIIALSQFKHLLGLEIPSSSNFFELLFLLIRAIPNTHLMTFALSVGSIVILLVFKTIIPKVLKQREMSPVAMTPITKGGPLFVVIVSTILVWQLGLDTKVNIVGEIPQGLPPLTLPSLNLGDIQRLFPVILTLTFVSFVEAFAVAKSLASQRRQKVDANQDLIALGTANLGSAFSGGYSVTGGFSRSVVNFTAGANTQLAAIITAVLIFITVWFLTPLFYFLPQASLAAIILVAVVNLIKIEPLQRLWRYNKADGVALLVTFFAVLITGVATGIVVGVIFSIILYLWRTSRPHIAIVGRVGESEHFRNIERHEVSTCPHVLAIRVDESLYFANTKALEGYLTNAILQYPQVKHLVLICSGINFIDGSALETLEQLIQEMEQIGVTFYLAEVKGPVMDHLEKAKFPERLGRDRIFLSTDQAMRTLECV
ncbi:solute carrier family 26 protein [Spirulina sp. CS-785/01]|uniref:SulP family inorganic anion transporter n=1 Tax=Spirulina sp. CS-785/01 TaxID=3021716 RepID=UPI00232F5011|nr:solute carrier family 26 protein [Spirulina sp. CS-785/01]MDB9314877.1 solute carrier family 26 protein [Spirulina sp. CS-785/01]